MAPITKKPKVIIVGAGLGGITLGILLEKAGQCYEEFEKIGKPSHTMELFNSEMKSMFVMDSTTREK
ncbi:hypothetical protein BGZ74_005543, partial [Mortierella antarctica]